MVYCYEGCTGDEWKKFIEVMNSGEMFECDEVMYGYWLEVLPPAHFSRVPVTFKDGTSRCVGFGFAEGEELITGFWSEAIPNSDERRYFGRQTVMMNRGH